MSPFKIALWGLVAIAVSLLAFLVLDQQGEQMTQSFGVPFSLETASGEPFSDEDMKGAPHMVFFGFTHCPEVCPTTLYESTGWINSLGNKARDLKVYFITVDPERDTRQVLNSYLSPFYPTVIGLTGSVEEIQKTARGYHVFYRKVPLEDGDYTMDHTASIFLLKADGSLMGTIGFGENSDTAIEKIERLLSS